MFIVIVSIALWAGVLLYEEAKDVDPIQIRIEFWKKVYISYYRVGMVMGTAMYNLVKDIFNPSNFKIKIF